ncbi:hypothetical protein Tco_0720976 [Tanacetum coccineum]
MESTLVYWHVEVYLSFDEYKRVFDNEVEQLSNEYTLRFGKKGYVLDDVWEKCKKYHRKIIDSWHDEGFEEEELWRDDDALPLGRVNGARFKAMIRKELKDKGTMAGEDIDTLTMEQYLALSRENQASGVVKPEIEGNVNFEIKSQFMRELREYTFSENKNEDAHDYIDRVLRIVGLFNIP